MTKLVIYIPTYNRLESLKTCLKSIDQQIQDGVKVYISNNASTDGTTEYLDGLNLPWLTVYHQPENYNGAYNQASAWYIPLETEYIWVIGDDDYLMPNAIKTLVAAITKHPVDFVFCNTQAFSKQDEKLVLNFWENGSLPSGSVKGKYNQTFVCAFHDLIDPMIADSLLLEIMCLCVRKDVVQKVDIEGLKGSPKGNFWDDGKYYTAAPGPLLESFTDQTTGLYLHPALTFNFWSGGNGWSDQYDYVFPVAILYMIEMYRKKEIINEEKHLTLLDYYFKLMGSSISRQYESRTTAKLFSDDIWDEINRCFYLLKNQNSLPLHKEN